MNKKAIACLLSLSILSVPAVYAGNKFNGDDKAVQHRDSYNIKKYSEDTYSFKKISDFGEFKIIKEQEYILSPKQVPLYTTYLNKSVIVGQNVSRVPTDKSLATISERLNRTRKESIILSVNQPSYVNVKYTFNRPLAEQKLKNTDKFEYVDYRDQKGRQIIQNVYGLNIIKQKAEQVLSKGYNRSTQSFFSNGGTDNTKYINELQRELDTSYPDIFKIETIQNYSY